MTRTGTTDLRYHLIKAPNASRVDDAKYKAYYEVKFKEVTKHQHKRALVLTPKKLVRLLSIPS